MGKCSILPFTAMLNASIRTERGKQHTHKKRDVDCFHTCPKKHTAFKHEVRCWMYKHVQREEVTTSTDTERWCMFSRMKEETCSGQTLGTMLNTSIWNERDWQQENNQTEINWFPTFIWKSAALTLGQLCWMHPSEQREVTCINTNREMLTAFILPHRSTACIH